jgi:hypothetical protein
VKLASKLLSNGAQNKAKIKAMEEAMQRHKIHL